MRCVWMSLVFLYYEFIHFDHRDLFRTTYIYDPVTVDPPLGFCFVGVGSKRYSLLALFPSPLELRQD